MNVYSVKGVKVEALACAVPKQKFSLTEYAPDLIDEKTAAQLEKVSGFRALRIAPDDVTTSDLCCEAAKYILNELSNSRGGVRNITALLFVSKTGDYVSPATTHVMQHRLGLSSSTICLDINEGCSGFITGLFTAATIAARTNGSVLFCGGDTNSKITSKKDRAMRSIMGDAGYAVLVSPDEAGEFLFTLESYGEKYNTIIMENSRCRFVDNPKNDGFYYMDGAEVMKFILSDVPKVVTSFMNAIDRTKDDFTFFAFHQANKLGLSMIAKKFGVPPEKMPFASEEYGNTSSATIPLLLSRLAGTRDYSRVMCAGFGVGLSAGVCTADFSRTKFLGTYEI